jgi:hypothetical protein
MRVEHKVSSKHVGLKMVGTLAATMVNYAWPLGTNNIIGNHCIISSRGGRNDIIRKWKPMYMTA